MENPGLGNFGSITFSNVNVDVSSHPSWVELRGAKASAGSGANTGMSDKTSLGKVIEQLREGMHD